uniref:Rho-GAP domain-containing protein n=1 Tax=Rhabditophanes sp. KR3021 TaxID=114890 RepID=A0AC35UA99_9BILA
MDSMDNKYGNTIQVLDDFNHLSASYQDSHNPLEIITLLLNENTFLAIIELCQSMLSQYKESLSFRKDLDEFRGSSIVRARNADSIQKICTSFRTPKGDVDLAGQFSETVTGCGKFIGAAENDYINKLNIAFSDLLRPNADTLAFICNHFQKVVSHSDQSKMSLESLPIIVGYSNNRRFPGASLKGREPRKQISTFKVLLKFPPSYLNHFTVQVPTKRDYMCTPI